MEETLGREGLAVELVSRVQLRAVFSGLAVAVGCYTICMGISWAIGFSTFQPTADHARGLTLANLIWGAIAVWISLFVGGLIAAIVGRSPDARSGVLHGLVVWGTAAGLIGAFVALLFGGLFPALVRLGGETAGAANVNTVAVGRVAQIAGVTIWIAWAGIVGALFTSILGGWLGGRSEEARAPKRIGVRPPAPAGVPQPA